MEIKLLRCYLKKILPKEKDNYSTYKEFYNVVSGNMKKYSNVNLDENPKDKSTKELKKFIKNLYNLDIDKYNKIYMNSKFYLAFIFNNIEYINRALTESKEPDYVLNNMLLIYNLQKSAAVSVVNTIINKDCITIPVTLNTEIMICQRSIRLRLLEQIRIDYLRNMNFSKKEDTIKAQQELEKALLTFVNDDVLLDYYHHIYSKKCILETLNQKFLEKRASEIARANKIANVPYMYVKIREEKKTLKRRKHDSTR